jgi:serine/threonine-protein kinase
MLIAGLGVGGWYLYRSNSAVQRNVNGFLINIGVLNPVLIVRSSLPGANVLVDGQDQGMTNSEGLLTIEGLKKGAHTITVSFDGYEKQEKQIDLTAPSMLVILGPPTPTGMVYVPGGTFRMGRDDGDAYERPAHEVTVATFYIDKHEVTCEEYQKFIDATGHAAPPGWANGKFPAGAARLPVTGVSWHDANDYAAWTGKRLPTEEEWEFAARGTDGRLYPWDNQWQDGAANIQGGPNRLMPVGQHSKSSPFGVFDMCGNVWEWTADGFSHYPGSQAAPPFNPDRLKILRGGSYQSGLNVATTTFRNWLPLTERNQAVGFRCVKSPD